MAPSCSVSASISSSLNARRASCATCSTSARVIRARVVRSGIRVRLLVGVEAAEGKFPPLVGRGGPLRIGIDAVDGTRGQALVAAATELRNDHDIGTVVENRAELRWAVPQARVAVDALRHLDANRRVLPFRIALVIRNALESRRSGHGFRVDAAPERSATIPAAATEE